MARKRFIFFNCWQPFLKKAFYFLLALLCVLNSPVLAQLPTTPTKTVEQGKILYDSGRYAEAVQVLRQAVSNYQKQGDKLSQAATLSNLALAYQQLGAISQAKQAIAESLKLLDGKNLEVLGPTLDIQGRLQLAMGQVEKAQATWQQVEKLYTQANDKSGIVRSRINLAQALRIQGNYRNAVKTLVELNKILQKQADSLEKIVGLRSLGDALQLVGDFENSRQALKQSLQIAQNFKSPAEIGASLFSLGNNARALQQKPQAIAYYEQTIKTSSSRITKIQAQLNHLSLLIEDKQTTQAQILIPPIQSQIEQLPPSRAAIYARINFAFFLTKVRSYELGVLNSSLPTPNSSLPTHNSSLPTHNSSLLLATAIQQSRNLGDKRTEAYGLLNLGGLYEQTQQLPEAQKLTQQALMLAQGSNAPDISYRASWQLGRLLKAQKDIKGAIAAYDAATETLQSLRSDLVAVNQDVQFTFRESVEPVYRQSVELLLQSQQGEPDAKTLDKARQRMEALQLAELDNFFREACLQGQKVPIDKVLDQDNRTAAILYPIILPDELQVIVKIPKQPLRHYTTKIPQAEVEKTVAQLRQNLVKPPAIRAVQADSQQVYNWLVKPIEAELTQSGVKTLVFVLDGALRNIPMAALYDGKQFLVEKYAIALSVGLQLQDPRPLVKERLNALTAGLTDPPAEYSNYPSLPSIKAEINSITKAGVSTTSLLDGQFTRKALESKFNTAPFNIVHLATHGEFSSRREKTFILAADGPINVTQFDTILSSRDESRPEAVQLLVLSACQTAAGDNRAALGLAGAAVRAGARSTVASLWQIDDESTALFVGAFYKELNSPNTSKAEALRLAQLQLLNHPNYNSPSFWSAYVLIGNWL